MSDVLEELQWETAEDIVIELTRDQNFSAMVLNDIKYINNNGFNEWLTKRNIAKFFVNVLCCKKYDEDQFLAFQDKIASLLVDEFEDLIK